MPRQINIDATLSYCQWRLFLSNKNFSCFFGLIKFNRLDFSRRKRLSDKYLIIGVILDNINFFINSKLIIYGFYSYPLLADTCPHWVNSSSIGINSYLCPLARFANNSMNLNSPRCNFRNLFFKKFFDKFWVDPR